MFSSVEIQYESNLKKKWDQTAPDTQLSHSRSQVQVQARPDDSTDKGSESGTGSKWLLE